jgi:hypothetical protein
VEKTPAAEAKRRHGGLLGTSLGGLEIRLHDIVSASGKVTVEVSDNSGCISMRCGLPTMAFLRRSSDLIAFIHVWMVTR